MGPVATINLRLPLELKERGSVVLEKNGVSISDLVRQLYSYMEREQSIPECLMDVQKDSAVERRRKLLRQSVGVLQGSQGVNVDQLKDERIVERYGEFL